LWKGMIIKATSFSSAKLHVFMHGGIRGNGSQGLHRNTILLFIILECIDDVIRLSLGVVEGGAARFSCVMDYKHC
jgi:hypothetical protein